MPLIAVTIIGAVILVPASRDDHAAKLDYLGTVLSTSGLAGLLYGIIEGPARG